MRWAPPCLAALLAVALAAPAAAQEGAKAARKEEAHVPVVTKAPAVTRFVSAAYPEAALQAGREADVLLVVDVDATGAVTGVTVARPAGEGFDEAAVEAVRAFGFTPAEVDGAPAPIRLEYEYRFRLEKRPAGSASGPSDAAGADEPSVRGVVRERGTRLPVVGAAVSIADREGEVRTDAKGAFRLDGLPPGKHRVQVIAPEYAPLDADAEVREGMVTELTLAVRPLEDNPYETVVRGEREQEVVARYTLSQREMTTVPGTFGDPVRVISNLPGMARSPYVLGLLLVRGSYPGDSAVYLDGVKVPLIYHFFGGPSILNPQLLERIDFMPGNFGARYGSATGGIVEVQTSSEVPEVWHGMADVNLFFASGYVEAPLAKGVVLKAGLRRSYYDLVIPIAMKIAGASGASVVPVYYDYQARLDVDLPADDHVTVFAFGSDDALAVATTDERTAQDIDVGTRTSFHRLTASHLWHATPTLTNRVTPVLGLDVGTFDAGESSASAWSLTTGVRDELSWRIHPRFELRPGLEFRWVRYRYSMDVPGERDYLVPGEDVTRNQFAEGGFDPNTDRQQISRTIDGFEVAPYLEAAWTPWDRLKIIPGVRFQTWHYLGRTRWAVDPRLNVRLDVGWDTTLKAGVGLYSKMPPEYLLDPDFGNPDLGVEWAEQYSFGVEHAFTKALSLDVQGFLIRRHDRAIVNQGLDATSTGIARVPYTNDGWGRAYGLEVLLKQAVSERFYGWISYTLSRSEDVIRPNQPLSPSRYDQTHILTLVASVRPGLGFEVGTRFRLVSGNPTTPVLDGTFIGDTSKYVRLRGDRDSARLPLFHQLDLRVERTWEFEQWLLSLYLDIQNVYNAKNPEATIWDYRYRRSYQIRGLPFLPTLGIKGQF